jgi:hypothetical protein
VDPVSPGQREEDGVRRIRRAVVVPPGGTTGEEDWRGANDAKVEKLRLNALRRRARTAGLELRHSSYGYALIGTARKPVDDRNDLSLDEIEARLDRALEQ